MINQSEFIQSFKSNLGFPPTLDQDSAIKKITNFAFNLSDLDLFILKGYAGTGKTSLMGALVKTLNSYKIKSVLLAPTGRAAKVLSYFTNKETSTVHRKIYFKNEMAGEDGFILGENKHTNTLFIIDEASMIGGQQSLESGFQRNLLDDLIEYVYSGNNCKLIFVGDTGQLPPVGTAQSPALSQDYLRRCYSLDIFESTLAQIVRQEDASGIVLMANQLRYFKPDFEGLIDNKRDTFFLSGMELQDTLDSAYSNYGNDEVMVITRSNKRANLFNQQIRHRILWQEDDLNAGDVLMCTRNNYFWLDPKSPAGFIANGELMTIKKVVRREEIYGFEFADVIATLIDYPEMKEIEVKIMVSSIMDEGPSLSRDKMKELFLRIAAEEYPLERNKKIRNRKVMTNPYFQALQVKFGYAVTCHKSQGGQWAAIFVDHGYFVDDMWDEEYMRWLYTAITRSTDKLYLVNFNPFFKFDKTEDEF